MRRSSRLAAYAVIIAGLVAVQGCTGGSGSSQPGSGGDTGNTSQPAAVAQLPAKAPSPGPRVCGQPALRSPFRYHGAAVSAARSGASPGLPTFGARGTDFPAATKIVVIPPGDNTGQASGGGFGADQTVFYFEPGHHVIGQGMLTGDNSVYVGGYTPAAGAAVLDGVNGAGGNKLSFSQTGVTDAR